MATTEETKSLFDKLMHDQEKTSKRCFCFQAIYSLRGVILALVTGILFASATTMVTLAERRNVHVFQICVIAYACLFVISAILSCVIRTQLCTQGKRDTAIMMVMGVTRWSSIVLAYYAFEYTQVGNVTAVVRGITPVLTSVLAFMFLHETVTIAEIVITTISIIGVLLVAAPSFIFKYTNVNGYDFQFPPDEAKPVIGYTLAIACGIIFSLTCLFARSLPKDGSAACRFIYDSLVGFILSVIFLYTLSPEPPVWSMSTLDAMSFTAYSVLDAIAIFTLYVSFQFELASTVSMLLNIEVVASYIFQTTILQSPPMIYQIIGAAVIILCSVLIAFIKWRQHKNDQ
ncbi:solute carrier family 35 member G1-like [Saccoglossus kowalevskii]|uniref:WAT1-related protein At1g43650-like n=1 Tax=Saccoglossus kowalevskii TaxID=10224 RepID=A0ABM0M9Z0_SACKO|nr:PREDICTED: WAT1-related protein At1g43650-like [Saccoglossus kowalevskii]